MFVPTNMTWLQQPLDVYAFRRYKSHLRRQYRLKKICNKLSKLSPMDVVLCIVAAIRHVLQGVAWDRAFDGCGFGLHGRSAGARLLKILERSAESVFFPPLEPSHAALLSILPRKRSYRLNLLLHTHWAPLPVPQRSRRDEKRGIDNVNDVEDGNLPTTTLDSQLEDVIDSFPDSWQARLRPRNRDHGMQARSSAFLQENILRSNSPTASSSGLRRCHSSMPAARPPTVLSQHRRGPVHRAKAIPVPRKASMMLS